MDSLGDGAHPHFRPQTAGRQGKTRSRPAKTGQKCRPALEKEEEHSPLQGKCSVIHLALSQGATVYTANIGIYFHSPNLFIIGYQIVTAEITAKTRLFCRQNVTSGRWGRGESKALDPQHYFNFGDALEGKVFGAGDHPAQVLLRDVQLLSQSSPG